MSAKPQYPGPSTPTTSTPQQHRRPRKLAREPAQARDESSTGGVLLPTPMVSASSQNSQTDPSSSKDPNTPAPTGPNRKRRPRKLNKDQPANSTAESGPSNTGPGDGGEDAVNHELEALKSRVRGLEAKVEELYKASSGRSPRRRGKGRKAATQPGQPADPASANAAPANDDAAAEEEVAAAAELRRLETELASARQDLASATRPPPPRRRRPARTTSGGGGGGNGGAGAGAGGGDADAVEEIPRLGGPAVEGGKDGKAVTLSGSYRIPLPASVSMADVRNIQSGIASAHAVARGFLDARRAETPPVAPRRRSAAGGAGGATAGGGGGGAAAAAGGAGGGGQGQGQSWSEWFGAYSMSISRAVKNIEADAALETAGQRSAAAKRPVAAPRRSSAPGVGSGKAGSPAAAAAAALRKATGSGAGARPSGTGKAAGTATAARPPLNPRTSNTTKVSAEQVRTLMS